MTPSNEQQAFVSAMLGGDSLSLQAVAGSGKTWTLVRGVQDMIPERLLAVAFNKRIKEELERKLPSWTNSMTLNGLGHRVVSASLPKGTRVKLSAWKSKDIIKRLVPTAPPKERLEFARALDWARASGLGVFPEVSWPDVLDSGDFDPDTNVDLLSSALLISERQATEGLIDFTDQLWLPTKLGSAAPWPRFDVLVVDEAQDLSPLQHRMLELVQPTRVICAGDPHQAIYGWRGAASDSMGLLQAQFGMKIFPLTVSFRCPKAVVELAREEVPFMSSAPGAAEGSVTYLDEFDHHSLPPGMVLCRNNAPLLGFALGLIRAERSFQVLGKDWFERITNLIEKWATQADTIRAMFACLNDWSEAQRERLRGRSSAILDDKVQAIDFLLASSSSPSDAVRKANLILRAEGRTEFLLSSIHRSKGLESPRVYILDSWLMPSKFATTDEELQQEANLSYVAKTRSLDELIYINTKKDKKEQEELD